MDQGGATLYAIWLPVTAGSAIPPGEIVSSSLGFSFMLFGLLDMDVLPPGVVREGELVGGEGTIVFRFIDCAPMDEDPNFKLNGILQLDITGDSETTTLVINGTLYPGVSADIDFDLITFNEATWVMPTPAPGEGENGGDGSPLDFEVSGSIIFDTVLYQFQDVYRTVIAAFSTMGLGELIFGTAGGFYFEYLSDSEAEVTGDGVTIVWEVFEQTVRVTFYGYEENTYILTGFILFTLNDEEDSPAADIIINGTITIGGDFPISSFAFNTLTMSWNEFVWGVEGPDGPPDSLTGSITIDGTYTYQGSYIMEIIELFDDGNGGNEE